MTDIQAIDKLPTGIDGFDYMALGGLPSGRGTLLTGAAGSGKTVFACQFLAEGIMRYGETGVFVTFEESADDVRRDMRGFGWDIGRWEQEGKWAFVDVSRPSTEELVVGTGYDLTALIARIEHRLRKLGGRRVVLDSIGSLLMQFDNANLVRRELFRIALMLKEQNVTSIITGERLDGDNRLTRYGVEEFVADNVVVLRNTREEEGRRRTIEIMKFRGAMHAKGAYPFTIFPGKGVVVIPLSALELTQPSSSDRVSTGIPDLDKMCGGGFFRGSAVLVAGSSGTGKSVLAVMFAADSQRQDERSIIFDFEESHDQLVHSAGGWGIDLPQQERDGMLLIRSVYPENAVLQDHLITIQTLVEQYRPSRVVINSLTALERIAPNRNLSEFLISLMAFLKRKQITTVYTASSSALFGGTSITGEQISSISDVIIMLRYLETDSDIRRGLAVLKMRGSRHDKRIRELLIGEHGAEIGEPFQGISGILTGQLSYLTARESDLAHHATTSSTGAPIA